MFVLSIVLVIGVLPVFPATKVEAANTISEAEMTARVKDLAVKLGLNENLSASDGKYFTQDGVSCGNKKCDKCNVSNVISSKSSWFGTTFGFTVDNPYILPSHFQDNSGVLNRGWSCCGFANFALWYVGRTDNNTDLSGESKIKAIAQGVAFTESNLRAYNLKIGDVIRCGGHSMMFLAYESNGIKVLDNNWQFTIGEDMERVRIHTCSYTNKYYANKIMGITRLANYEPGGSVPVPSVDLSTAEVTNRIKDLATRMGLDANLAYSNGTYFTANGQACCGRSSCDNCKLENVISSAWFNTAFGFTITDKSILSRHYACEEMRVNGAGSCGFANLALWYVGKDSNTSNLYDESNITAITRGTYFTEANLTSLNLKIGDVIYCNKSNGAAGKSAVFLGYEAGGIKVMDANWGADGTQMRMAIHHWSYNDTNFANGTMAVTRLARHNPDSDSAIPVITNVVITDVDATGYTVTATATDDVGVTAVRFPTRRSDQDDEDWIWYDGIKNADGSYSKRININEFENKGGTYYTHIYAYDAADKISVGRGIEQYVDATAPVISDVKITNVTGGGYTVECTVTDDVGVDRVQFPTWTDYNGQDDLLEGWQNSELVRGTASGNVYKFRVYDVDHGYERGTYNTHIYAFDAVGNFSKVECTQEVKNKGVVIAETTYNAHTYKVIDDKLTWEEAEAACEAMGGHLVTITSAEEQAVVESLMDASNKLVGYYIGGRMGNNTLRWITGESVSYTNWYPGEPSVTDGETVCELYTHYLVSHIGNTSDAYRWNNIMNDAEGRAYICEIEPTPVTSIALSETNIELGINQTKTLTATILPKEGSFPAVVWSSADTKIATVSNGVITAVGAGTTTITAECGGKKATCTVKVVKPFSSVSFDATSKTLFKNESVKLNVSYSPSDANASKELIWSSSNTKVATVDNNGVVTALSAGTAKITAKLKGNKSISANCTVQVNSYIVTFDTKGGSSVAAVECGKGEVLSVAAPTKDGYAFTGWYTDSSCTVPWSMETAVVEKSMTLYAGWMEYHEGLWIVEIPNQEYTGKAIKPEIEVYHNAEKLQQGKDYTVAYKNNTNAADKTSEKAPAVTVTGKGNYAGKETAKFSILSQTLNDESIVIDDIFCAANGKEQRKLPVVTWNGKKLKKDKDYTVTYPDTTPGAYINTGTYTVLVTGKGNFNGERQIQLQITGLNLISKTITSKIANQMYTGSAIEPAFTVKYGPVILSEGRDYEVSYSNNTSVGTATIVITGMGSYSGEKRVSFKIVGTPLSKAKVYNLPKSVVYDGSAQNDLTYELQMIQGGINKTLTEGKDYKVAYSNNTSVGTASITFSGINGYTGSVKKTFKITPYNIGIDDKNAIVVSDDYVVAYMKGNTVIEPVVTYLGKTLVNGKDYKLTYKNNKNVSANADYNKKPLVTITGKGNYTGNLSFNFEIVKQNISELNMSVPDKLYQNKAGNYASVPLIKDVNGKKLVAGTDYEKKPAYTYTYNTKLANGTVCPAGSAVGAWDIVPAGTEITVTVKGLGNYNGEISSTYRVVQADISKAKGTVVNQIYTGKAIEPGKEQIALKIGGFKLADSDYEIVSYSNNVNKGTGTIVVKGVGNYGGTKTITFKIQTKSFSWWWR